MTVTVAVAFDFVSKGLARSMGSATIASGEQHNHEKSQEGKGKKDLSQHDENLSSNCASHRVARARHR